MKDRYIFAHHVGIFGVLLGILVEIYGNLSQVTSKNAAQDQHGLALTCLDSIPVTYHRQTLMQLKSQCTNANLDIKTKLKIAEFTIKRTFRRRKGVEKVEIGIKTVTHVKALY